MPRWRGKVKVISLHGYLRVYCTHTVLIHLDCFCVSLVHVQCVHLSGTVEEVGRQGGSGPMSSVQQCHMQCKATVCAGVRRWMPGGSGESQDAWQSGSLAGGSGESQHQQQPWQSGSAVQGGSGGQMHHGPWQSGSLAGGSGESHHGPWQSGSMQGGSGESHHGPWQSGSMSQPGPAAACNACHALCDASVGASGSTIGWG